MNSYFDYCLQSTQILLILENINASSPIHIVSRSKRWAAEKWEAIEERDTETERETILLCIVIDFTSTSTTVYDVFVCVCVRRERKREKWMRFNIRIGIDCAHTNAHTIFIKSIMILFPNLCRKIFLESHQTNGIACVQPMK